MKLFALVSSVVAYDFYGEFNQLLFSSDDEVSMFDKKCTNIG